jgi:hypothetical protein
LPKFKKFEVKDWIVHREHLYRKRPYLSVLQQSVTSLSQLKTGQPETPVLHSSLTKAVSLAQDLKRQPTKAEGLVSQKTVKFAAGKDDEGSRLEKAKSMLKSIVTNTKQAEVQTI